MEVSCSCLPARVQSGRGQAETLTKSSPSSPLNPQLLPSVPRLSVSMSLGLQRERRQGHL